MTENSEIILSTPEMLQAAMIGIIRQIQNLEANRQPTYGSGGGPLWQMHIEGAMGECAVAKYRGVYWNGNVGNLHAQDVGKYQVRTGAGDNYRLILHPEDKNEDVFILVTGAYGKYNIRGWLWAFEGKIPKFWEDPSGKNRPAYFVDQTHLHPMETLPSLSAFEN